ncbi:MAG TPA: class I SAM-dependent methyltransferase [Acidimicrobiales bacterium]|nr:class I SAM-dependent methyltransferase [Acidimicrobiales bacterium]
MNRTHLDLCSSAEWADACRRWIIPWVLDGLDLGADVLELGPGPGRTTEVLAELVPHLAAAELDPALAADLAARLPEVEVLEADATDLPHEAGSFSAVLCFTMLHHLPSRGHQDRLFAQAARVLRSGGVFAGTDSLDGEDFRQLHVDDICVPIDPSGLEARLEAAGLVRVEVAIDDSRVRFRGWRP